MSIVIWVLIDNLDIDAPDIRYLTYSTQYTEIYIYINIYVFQ